MQKTLDKIDFSFVIVLAVVSGIIGLLGSFGFLLGFLPQQSTLAEALPALSIFILGIIAGHLAYQRKSKLDQIEKLLTGIDKTISSVGGTSIKQLKTSQGAYEYVAKRMVEPNIKKVDDLTWGIPSPTGQIQALEQAFNKYRRAITMAASQKGVHYREVMTFPRGERVDLARKIVKQNLFNYELKYYNLDYDHTPPLLVFMIIESTDFKEVILPFYRGIYEPDEEIPLVIGQGEIVQLFQNYYNSIWRNAEFIKKIGIGEEVTHAINKLDQIHNEVTQPHATQ